MNESLYRIARSSVLICGFALAGCGAMNSSGGVASSDTTGTATTQPSAANNSAAKTANYQEGNNQSIGNGAFGETPP